MFWLIVLVACVIWGLSGLRNRVSVTYNSVDRTRYYCPNHEGTFIVEGTAPQVNCPICTSTLRNMEAQFNEGHENLR